MKLVFEFFKFIAPTIISVCIYIIIYVVLNYFCSVSVVTQSQSILNTCTSDSEGRQLIGARPRRQLY